MATREAIAEATGLAPDLRWPNDVLIDGRKCAGIIAQLDGDAVIAGIGINVSQTEFPPEFEATSLRLSGAHGRARGYSGEAAPRGRPLLRGAAGGDSANVRGVIQLRARAQGTG